jgi:hypothetical protein
MAHPGQVEVWYSNKERFVALVCVSASPKTFIYVYVTPSLGLTIETAIVREYPAAIVTRET